MTQLANVPGFTTSITYQPITKAWLEAARAASGDAIDLDPDDGGLIGTPILEEATCPSTNCVVVLIANIWTDPAQDTLSTEFAQDAVAALEAAAKEAGVYHPWINLNDAGAAQDPFATYGGGPSLARMKDIRDRYGMPLTG